MAMAVAEEIAAACRVCGRNVILRGDCFCEHCGWPTTRLEVLNWPRSSVIGVPASGRYFRVPFILRRQGPGKLAVSVALTVPQAQWVTLARANQDARTHQFDLEDGREQEEVALRFDRELADREHMGSGGITLEIEIQSNDGGPPEGAAGIYRPYDLASCQRSDRRRLVVVLLSPGKLLVDQEVLFFSRRRQERRLRIRNIGGSPLTVIAPSALSGYEITDADNNPLVPGRDLPPLERGRDMLLRVAPAQPGRVPQATLEIATRDGQRAPVLVRPDPRPENLPQGELPFYVIGYDFGTYKTAVCYLDNSQPGAEIRAVPLGESGERTTMRSTLVVVSNPGGARESRAGTDPAMFPYDPETVWVWQSMKTALRVDTPADVLGEEKPMSWVVGTFLRHVEGRVRRELPGDRSRDRVFGLPVLDQYVKEAAGGHLYQLQEENTRVAAREAGIADALFQLEPVCAGRYVIRKAWMSGDPPIRSGDIVCVWDFGGGTLDIAVLEVIIQGNELSLRVLLNIGTYLEGESLDVSGDRVDQLLFDYFYRRERWRVEELPPPDGESVMRGSARVADPVTVRRSVRVAKERLNTPVEGIYPEQITVPELLDVQLTRAEFDGLVRPDIAAALARLRAAVAAHEELRDRPINHFFLVGGSSMMAIVPQMIGEEFPTANIVSPPNAEEAMMAVSRGAALAREVRIVNVLGFRVLVQPLSESSGTAIGGDVFSPATILPARREMLFLAPASPLTCALLLEHGDQRWRAATFEVPAGTRTEDRVLLRFDADAQGSLRVSAGLRTTGAEQPELEDRVVYDL